jgi:hypothetical protein
MSKLSSDENKQEMLSRTDVRKLMPPLQENDCDAYNSIRDECFKRIEAHAAKGEEFCFYVVPPFHFGLPVYDSEEVFMKLYAELGQLNYQLLAWPSARRIFIAWYEEEETAMENIRSAMEMYQQQQQDDETACLKETES